MVVAFVKVKVPAQPCMSPKVELVASKEPDSVYDSASIAASCFRFAAGSSRKKKSEPIVMPKPYRGSA